MSNQSGCSYCNKNTYNDHTDLWANKKADCEDPAKGDTTWVETKKNQKGKPYQSLIRKYTSDVPIQEIESIFLDYQSKTSVELLKILLKEYWQVSPKLIEAKANYEKQIKGEKAGLIIGDRVFQYQNKFKYIYDLSAIWKLHTGLPFVFACWIANKKIDEDFQKEFNKALKFGVNNIEKAIDSSADIYSHCENPADYLNNKISYILDADKKKGMVLFLGKI